VYRNIVSIIQPPFGGETFSVQRSPSAFGV